jgi:thioredoxin reductase (NADPH)
MENTIIVGGGPAGLSTAIYAARAGLSPLVFAGFPPGGQLTTTTEVENYPGYTTILGPELIMNMRKQAEYNGAKFLDENITEVVFSKTPLVLKTEKDEYKTTSVVIATGAKALWLGLSSEQRLRGRGVSACATCDGLFFRNKIVAVVGGGDTALEEASTLAKMAEKVYLIHRRSEFRASKAMQERVMKNEKIESIFNASVDEVMGEEKVTGVRLKFNSDVNKEDHELQLDGLFVAIGHKPDTDIFKDQIILDQKGYIMTTAMAALEKSEDINKFNFDFQTMTSVEGVFAAGDCVDKVYRQASTSVGMGVAAALDTERWLNNKNNN